MERWPENKQKLPPKLNEISTKFEPTKIKQISKKSFHKTSKNSTKIPEIFIETSIKRIQQFKFNMSIFKQRLNITTQR